MEITSVGLQMQATIEEQQHVPSALQYQVIDHIAIAVEDLEKAVILFRDVLGFELKKRRHIKGVHSGMISAEMEHNGIKFVLCQGTEPASQVSQLVSRHGAGVAHIALRVKDVHGVVNSLKDNGMSFDTSIIEGAGLTQAFSTRESNTGLSFEFIARDGEEEFLEANVQSLFDQLEASNKY